MIITIKQVQEQHLQEATGTYRYDLHIPVILGIENEHLDQLVQEDIKKDMNKYLQELKLTANGYIKPTTPYYLESTYEIHTHDAKLLSFCLLYTNYFGGAHSMSYNKCYNYDLKTGKRLALKDLFKDAAYKEMINHEILKQIEERNKVLGYEAINAFKGVSDRQKFYIKEGQLVITFDLYEVAPYVAGIVEFTMPKEIYSEMK